MKRQTTFDRHQSLRRFCGLVVLVISLAIVSGTAASDAKALNPSQTTVAGVVNKTLPDLNAVWWTVFRNAGWTHLWANTGVGLYNPGPYTNYLGACGYPSLGNAYYCPGDHSIYLDQTWVHTFLNRYGDGAVAMILAHEYGHHIAHLEGYPAGLAAELNADCLAGIYFRWGVGVSRVLNYNDYLEARSLIWNVLGTDPVGHGTAQQRLAWFDYGYTAYDLGACNRAFG